MSNKLKKTLVAASFALAAFMSSTAVSFAGSCMTSGGAPEALLKEAQENTAEVMSRYTGKGAMSDAIRLLVASDTTLVGKVIAAATGEQRAAVGAGLARAAKVCEPKDMALAQEILDAVAKLDPRDPLVAAFQSGLDQTPIASTDVAAPGAELAPALGQSADGTSGAAGSGGGGTGTDSGNTGESQGSTGLRTSASGGGGSSRDATDSQSGTST